MLTIVGERIRYLRKNRGMTQEQLGEKVGLPQSYIGGIERGEKNISLDTLERIISALNIIPEEVFQTRKDTNNFEKEKRIDMISLKLSERDLDEIEIIQNLVFDILKAFDKRYKK
ncbi:helix-turn-helix domain-containing protein [Paenibacillus sp. NPDC057886]|uniref:helix-turn-helix domain-containing protein n=1 Tax=Paenibacillus sp. NPDC057886 TaxID=3346270 RepID=UPI00367451CB